jgi:hypothetical protein
MSNDIPLATDQYIQDLLQQLGELEAEKAELVADKSELIMALILANEEIDDIDMHSKNFALIQKHAKK